VLSGKRAHDRVTKRYLYAEAGVREDWTVDLASAVVERRTGEGLAEVEACETHLESELLQGFALDLPSSRRAEPMSRSPSRGEEPRSAPKPLPRALYSADTLA
jgi:hypothetical protein